MPSGAAPPSPPESPATGGSPGEVTVAWGSSSPGAAMCPPFQCRQDEASLTLLLHVPGIQPHSLSGDVGTNHYSLRFSTDTGTFTLFLQFPPANRLLSPETCVSVSAHNAVITLAKAAGSAGPWEKFCFGLDASALQVNGLETAPWLVLLGSLREWWLREVSGYRSEFGRSW
ncbi:protein kintoun [Patagioenas fasciata monilis]|uniref:Protein kintoun n=1 Tax=Patagioenas fasciata monilis TaxID=372326 RepID=A0A1V4KQ83_PATFA|nr:protein kintoun [Patagioenas fasciata monilis]